MGSEESCDHDCCCNQSIFPPSEIKEMLKEKEENDKRLYERYYNLIKERFLGYLKSNVRKNPYMKELKLAYEGPWKNESKPDEIFCEACHDVANELKTLRYKVKEAHITNKKLDDNPPARKDVCEIY